ncbi:MAG: hypothetical protein WD810_02930 [Solirubrobacterales bacterium]
MSAAEEIASPPPPLRGEILKLDDIDTGFSANNPKRNRPYVVVNTVGMLVRVVPQSTNMERGVLVPEGAVDGLEEGCFVPRAANVRLSIVLRGEPMGHLPEPYLEAVIAQAYP